MKQVWTAKPVSIDAYPVTVDNMQQLESFCNGSIKGTSLPPDERCIEVWDDRKDTEKRADVGDFLVQRDDGTWTAMTFDELNADYTDR